MVEQESQANQYIVVERPDLHGEVKEIWRGDPTDFRRRRRYMKTADVSLVFEKDGVPIAKLALNVSRRFQGLKPA